MNIHAQAEATIEKLIRIRLLKALLLRNGVRAFILNTEAMPALVNLFNCDAGETVRSVCADFLVETELAGMPSSLHLQGIDDLAMKAVTTKDFTTWDRLVVALNNRMELLEVFGPTAVREVIAEVLGMATPDIQAHELPELDVTF